MSLSNPYEVSEGFRWF